MQALERDDEVWPIYVLVVEDEPFLRSLLADELRDVGFTVVEAANADEALAYAQVNRNIDLVFSDIQMPGSMNGIALAASLRAANPALPVILTSGNIVPDTVTQLSAFVPKPYRLAEAVSLVFKTLGVAPRGQED
ncbi:response regulator [Sphingomonas suaedae]|uniref:Response regulator n=1 Tax=Sphingomonas suaedae TaxID=2599297 RepID=A0A518RL60_9SPHN|nr:response regulator [Sphingomonas suaedae]QDX28183.1 response regulator [Sphingomonas suaedae]